MKRNLLTLFSVLICFYSHAQQSTTKLHAFDGDFTFNEFIGKAHYSYANDQDGTRLFNGPFSFTGNMSGKLFLAVQGSFKDDAKDGIWTYTSTLKKGLVTSLKQTLTANYRTGTLTGLLKVSANTTIHTKLQNYTVIISGTAQMSNNTFIGQILYDRKIIGRNNLLKPLTLRGQFNDAGFCDGTWTVVYQNSDAKMFEAKITFINGVMISVKDIDQQTGEIEGSYDHPELIDDAKQLTIFKDESTVNGVTKKWKMSVSEISQLAEVQNLFGDQSLHLNPKGYYGALPQFKTRVLRNY